MNYRLMDRQKKLLDLLSSKPQLTSETLAQILSVSSRTIRNDVAAINSTIGHDVILSTQKGYSINPVHFQLLRHVDTYFDEKAMKMQLLWKLFSGNTSCDTDELAEIFYTNPSVIQHILKELTDELAEEQLKLKKLSNHYQIDGEEFAKRNYLNRMILSEAHSPIFEVAQYASYFGEISLEDLKQLVINSLLGHDIVPSDISIDNLVLNIALTLHRLLRGYSLSQITSTLEIEVKQAELGVAKEIAAYFHEKHQLMVSDNDLQYIYLLVLGQSKRKYEDLLSRQFVSDISELLSGTFLHFSLDLSYERILDELAFHIYYLIIRSNVGNYTSNSLLENIKTYCPFVYDVAVYLTNQISIRFGVMIADCEIGFLALLIGGLLEHTQNEDDKINAVIVCGNHLKIGQNLLTGLQKRYESRINFLGIIPRFPHNMLESQNVLYLSCLPAHAPFNNIVAISSLLSSEDFCRIDACIDSFRENAKRSKMRELAGSFFKQELFFRNVSMKSKYDVIRFLGQKVVELGYAPEDFVASAVKRERISTTCFFDSFAIPHSIHLSADKSAFCILTSDKAMAWDDKKIKFVCMIAVANKDLEVFQLLYPHIINILCDYQHISSLSQAKTFEDFMEYINQVL